MIITKTEPYSIEEIEMLKEQFDVYIKAVIDIVNNVCTAGMNRHFEGEEILIKQASKQSDFNYFINIRPNDNNTSNEIQSPEIRKEYEKLTRYFFKEIL